MSEKKSVLAVDDEKKITEVIKSYLEAKGYDVATAAGGQEALALFQQDSFSLVLLDLMLPDISGEEVCRQIRQRSTVPIIMVTAKVEEEDLLKGLRTGADDYLRKPFSLKELHARVEALLRRAAVAAVTAAPQASGTSLVSGRPSGTVPAPGAPAETLIFNDGNLSIDPQQRTAQKKGRTITLTPTEFAILYGLARHPSKVFTRDELIGLTLGDDFDGFDRAVDSHIKNLRKKLEDDSRNPVYIKTVHGVGYRFGGA